MTDLDTPFHTIGGNSISQHYNNFFLFCNKLSLLEPTERLHILTNLKPQRRQEELFFTRLLVKYEYKNQLREIVISGDKILNKIIFRHKPFVFKGCDLNFFIKLFPEISFSVRCKCINRLALTIQDNKVGEEFFTTINEKYGIRAATPLLITCSEDFIRSKLTQFRIHFNNRHLVRLHSRIGYNIIDKYYKECALYVKKGAFERQRFFARYLSLTDAQTFCRLLKHGIPRIGLVGFENVIQIIKNEFIEDPCKYANLANQRVIYKCLSQEEYSQYFLNKFPPYSLAIDYNSVFADLKLLSIGKRGTLLAKAYREKYGYDIWTVPVLTDYDTLGWHLHSLSVHDRRKFKLSEEDMLECQSPSEAFPLIKKRITFTSDMTARNKLLLQLFKCAKNYNDDKALLEAFEYASRRYKNDQTTLRQDIFLYLKDAYKMKGFSDTIWKYITDLMLSEEINGHKPYIKCSMLEELMLYKFHKGLDIIEDFKSYVKCNDSYYLQTISTDKALQKWAILKYPVVCTEVYTEEDDKKRWPYRFISLLHTWNSNNPKDLISLYHFPGVFEQAVECSCVVDGYNYYLPLILMSKAGLSDVKNEIQCLHKLELFIDQHQIWPWLLKRHVDIVNKNVDLVFHKRANIKQNFFYELHKMHYHPIAEKVRHKALEVLKDKKADESVHLRAVVALSFEKDFLAIVEEHGFYPSGEAEINMYEENIKQKVAFRKNVLSCFKNRVFSKEVMKPILRFCYKDYFETTLSVLTGVLYNTAEKNLDEAISVLEGRQSMTIRKCALSFRINLCQVDVAFNALKLAAAEKHPSFQKHIFSCTYKLFRDVGNSQTWDLFMDSFRYVFEKDSESIDLILMFNLIPKIYLGLYVEKVWYQLKQWKDQHHRVQNAITTDIMPFLKDALCDDIIHFNLEHSKKQLEKCDVEFIYRYLLTSKDKLNHRFELVSKAAENLIDTSEEGVTNVTKQTHKCWFLYDNIRERLMKKDEAENNVDKKICLVDKLISMLPYFTLVSDKFDYELQLHICKKFIEDEANLPSLFIEQQKTLIEQSGELMVGYFNDFLADIKLSISVNSGYWLNFIEKLLKNDDKYVKIMALSLLPTKYPANEKQALQFNNLIDKIRDNASVIVLLHLNRLLRNLDV